VPGRSGGLVFRSARHQAIGRHADPDEPLRGNVRGGEGPACPGPLLEAKKGIGAIKVNEVLEIWSGDPRTKEDIPRWAAKVGHEYLGTCQPGADRIFMALKYEVVHGRNSVPLGQDLILATLSGGYAGPTQ
jgi:TusA-related sulfurtransferase